jgi:hypothetical protein
MGFHQSRVRNELRRTGPVARGLVGQGGESLRKVMSREDESEKKNVMRMEVTSPSPLNQG